jgi:hypothetical protein
MYVVGTYVRMYVRIVYIVCMYVSAHKPKKHHLLAVLGFLAYTLQLNGTSDDSVLRPKSGDAPSMWHSLTVFYTVDISIPVFNFLHDLPISRVTYLQKGRYTENTTKGKISFVLNIIFMKCYWSDSENPQNSSLKHISFAKYQTQHHLNKKCKY